MTDSTDKNKPRCEGTVNAIDGSLRRCSNDGYHCWVSGEFGRLAKVLCMRCIAKLKNVGWTVRYQLEGDSPEPAKEA